MRRLLFILFFVPACVRAQTLLTADDLMARVAANQDQSQAERAHYVYTQHVRVASRKGKTVRCEEITDVRVTPSATGSHQSLVKLNGRLLVKHQYVTYDKLPPNNATYKKPENTAVDVDKADVNITINSEDESTMDRDLVETMRSNLTDDKSKDGLGKGLFPLTSKVQADYNYHLQGTEHLNGREVFHVSFKPKDNDDYGWRGDAYIDTAAFQPVLVRTTMARKLPFAIRTLLGTSLPGLGFTVIYAPQPNDQSGSVWFPISFGTEFKLHVLFFLNREITLSAENRDFQQTHVTSTVTPSQE